MHLSLRVVAVAALAVTLPLAASKPASAQRVIYTGQTANTLSVTYHDLPAATQLLFANQVSGDTYVPLIPLLSGSGSITIPFALPEGPGQYYVLAKKAGLWVAESVVFYTQILP
jgi:hypothetical protein